MQGLAENEQLFDVIDRAGKIVLVRRARPVASGGLPALVQSARPVLFVVLWLLIGFYSLVINCRTGHSPAWFCLWGFIPHLFARFIDKEKMSLPTLRVAWRAWRGDTWTFDIAGDRLEHNSRLVAPLSQIAYISLCRIKQANGQPFTLCKITTRQGKMITLCDDGPSRANFEELRDIAFLLERYTHIRALTVDHVETGPMEPPGTGMQPPATGQPPTIGQAPALPS